MRLLPLSSVIHFAAAYKFLVYLPSAGRSHVNFLGALADILVDAGHEVVALRPLFDKSVGSTGTKKARVIEVPQCEAAREMEVLALKEGGFASNVWTSKSFFLLFPTMITFGDAIRDQCNYTLNHPHLLEQLKEEKFDVAFAENMDMCGFGIFNVLGIDKMVWTTSIGTVDGTFDVSGVPSFPSYVPEDEIEGALASYSDKMTFFQRVLNTIQHSTFGMMMSFFSRPLFDLFAERFPELPKGTGLMDKTSLIFVNSDPLVDFPRVTSHRIIDIGGIVVSSGHQPLNKTWSAIFSLRPKTVLLSFGSVAKSFLMPEAYKESIREAFRKFPDVTFIWKYEKPEHNISKGIDNIIESSWVPQNDILHDPRLSLFITHCGAGSTMEAMNAGVPLIVIPVMGDQERNAQMVKRTGNGIVLAKTDLESSTKLEEALTEAFSNDIYAEKAKKTADILNHRPFTMKELFVRNMEFVARFGPLRMLDHYGRHMSFIQYYLIDVLVFTAVVLTVLISIFLLIARFIFRSVFALTKAKAKMQ